MQYQLAIFDMDGTIIDSRPFHAAVFEDFFQENWRPVSYEICYQAVGVTVRTVFESVGIPKELHERFFDRLASYYEKKAGEFLKQTALAEGILLVLDNLHAAGVKTAIVTNSLDDVVRMFLSFHGISDRFDVVYGADRNSLTKNERCRKVQERYGISPERVLYVGDAESDIVLANEMGYDACFAKTKIAWHKDADYIASVLKPKYTVTTYAELLKLLKTMEIQTGTVGEN